MNTVARTPGEQDAILIVGDWRWRKGPRWKALAAWMFGRREVFRTHLQHVAEIAWWRGEPYLIRLDEFRARERDGRMVASAPTTPPPPKPKR